MNPASVIFLETGMMTLVYGEGLKMHFDSVSVLVNFCKDNNIEVQEYCSVI